MTPAAAISTVLGVGRAPYAPGTAGSLVALPFAWGLALLGGPLAVGAAALAVTALGVWASGQYGRATGKDDPGECVIDEVAGQWLACAFAPLSLPGYALAFILFRALDMLKPWPVSAGEDLPGGWGVMADDVIAGVIAGGIILLAGHSGLL